MKAEPATWWRAVRALELPTGDYAIFGSAPLAIRGLLENISDVDIVARGAAWERACRLGTPQPAPKGDQVVRLHDGIIEIYDAWLDLPVDEIIEGAELVEGLPFASLAHVLAYKRKLDREKDREHIRRIEAYLRRGMPED